MKIETGVTGGVLQPGGARGLVWLVAQAMAVGVFASLVLGLAAFIVASTAQY